MCGRLNPPVEQAYSTYATDFQNGNIAGAEAAAVQFQEGAAAELTALRALGLPTEGGATVEQLLSLEQELITDLESGTPQSEIVQQARVVSQQIASLAQQYGFKVCGVT
ncbi:MAG TPA: hypothetical protein VKT18_09645 [Acidimicrobiales bacterium]|nr:hypothetical protein [Acidimicrobiales bacterium]